MPRGVKKDAPAPAPSAKVAEPEPARVLSAPPTSTRTRWLFESVIRSAPLPVRAMPEGL